MKFLIVLVSALVLCRGASVQPREFIDQLVEFMELTDELIGDQMVAVGEAYFEDEEFQATMEWLRTADFNTLLTEMETISEFNVIVDYVENLGIYVRDLIKNLHEAAIGRSRKTVLAKQKTGSGYSGYLNDIHAILPHEQLHAMFDDKMGNDAEFSSVVLALQSDEFQQKWDALFANDQFQDELDSLLAHGMDVRLLLQITLEFFGVGK